MRELIATIAECSIARLLIICILLDVVLGVLRSLKYGKINSSTGIDGLIRKSSMFIVVVCTNAVDLIFNFNVAQFMPKEVVSFLGLSTVGVAEAFALIFILCEIISILKNMLLCGLPLPKGLVLKLYAMLDKWTDEVVDFDLVEDDNGRCKIARKVKHS